MSWPAHYEIWKCCHSTSKVHALVLQNLRVQQVPAEAHPAVNLPMSLPDWAASSMLVLAIARSVVATEFGPPARKSVGHRLLEGLAPGRPALFKAWAGCSATSACSCTERSWSAKLGSPSGRGAAGLCVCLLLTAPGVQPADCFSLSCI